MASAVLLDEVDFPDEELPSYEDTPSHSAVIPGPAPTGINPAQPQFNR